MASDEEPQLAEVLDAQASESDPDEPVFVMDYLREFGFEEEQVQAVAFHYFMERIAATPQEIAETAKELGLWVPTEPFIES